MSKNKLTKFAMNDDAGNVIQPGKELFDKIKGKWDELFFKNGNDLVLELACGRGEYTVGLGEVYRDKNYVGIDIKGARIWKGSQRAIEKGLTNTAFLRTKIHEIEDFFGENEVSEIWIIHPDPRPKGSDERRRLTHPRFLDMYRRIMKPDGIIHFKTDSDSLFEYTLEVLEEQGIKPLEVTNDLHNSPLLAKHHGIKTWYESLGIDEGRTIKYLEFQL